MCSLWFYYDYQSYNVQPAKYYMLFSITLIALIPVLIGIVFGKIMSDKVRQKEINVAASFPRDVLYFLLKRIIASYIFSFILIILCIWLLKPVPTQGWLRTLYAAILFSVQSPFVLLFIYTTRDKKIAGISLSAFYWIFLIVLPLGLMVHHPWNYFAFFSQFYWIAWAWMIRLPLQSLICGSISLILTSITLSILLKYLKKRHSI